MFERYTERARRVIFFARYEASLIGSPYIEPEHLLLGLLREDKALASQFLTSRAAGEEIRQQIEARAVKREKISTSVDLPLNANSKRALTFAAEEASSSSEIDTAHLLLGILRLENDFAAGVLRERGLTVESVRQELKGAVPKGSVKKTHSKPTACRDCRHLIVDESEDESGKKIECFRLFCGASPAPAVFDCYTGEMREPKPDAPLATRFKLCRTINFGECRLFEPKQEPDQGLADTR